MVSPNTVAAAVMFMCNLGMVAACASNQTSNVAIKTIPGGNGPTLDLPTAQGCEAACCQYSNCTAWSFIPETRGGCPLHGCCFLKDASPEDVRKYSEKASGYTTGCRGFECPMPPAPPAPPPSPPRPPLPFPYVTPSYTIDRLFASIPDTTLRDPTTALFDPVTSSWY